MDSLFEILYQYAAENQCGLFSSEDREEQEQCQDMVRRAMEELAANGYGDLAQRMEHGLKTLSCWASAVSSGRGWPWAWS